MLRVLPVPLENFPFASVVRGDMARHDGQKIEMATQDGHNTTLVN